MEPQMNADERQPSAIETEHEAEAVQSALEVLEAVLTAHCVAREEHAVLLVRQGDFAYRRLLGPHGVLTPPEWLGDGQLLDWHRARADLNEPAVRAIEQIIRDAHAAGAKVAVCPPDARTHAVRIGPAEPAAEEPEAAVVGVAGTCDARGDAEPQCVLALDDYGYDALYLDGRLAVRDRTLYAGQVLPAVAERFGFGYEGIDVELPAGDDFPPTLAELRAFEVREDSGTGSESIVNRQS